MSTRRKTSAGRYERLIGLFGKLGDANEYERANAFNLLDAFLGKQGASWKDLPRLLVDPGWTIAATVNPDIIYHVSRLAPDNPEEHRKSYEWLLEFLAKRRKNWNDLTELLRFPKSPTWADDSSALPCPAGRPLAATGVQQAQILTLRQAGKSLRAIAAAAGPGSAPSTPLSARIKGPIARRGDPAEAAPL
jgi:hypothetical protein